MRKSRVVLSVFIALLLSVAMMATLAEASLTFSGSGTNPATGNALAASATFNLSGSSLTILLTNISLADVTAPSDVFTGIFFANAGGALTPVSAVLGAGSSVLFGGTDPGGVVGGEWEYRSGVNNGYGNNTTISAGLGLNGSGTMFPGSNLQGPAAVDGVQYGITSAGDNPATGNAAVTGGNALIKNSVLLTLTAPAGFSLSDISSVVFQYGTALDEPHFGSPEPSTMLLFGAGLFGVGLLRKRFKK